MRGLKLNNTIIKKTVRNQTKNVTPYVGGQQVLPDAGFDGLGEVNIADIPTTIVIDDVTNPNGYIMFIGAEHPKKWKAVIQNGSIINNTYIDHVEGGSFGTRSDASVSPTIYYLSDLNNHNSYSYYTQGTSSTKYWYLDPCVDFSIYLKPGYKYWIGDNVAFKDSSTTYAGISYYYAAGRSTTIDDTISEDGKETKRNFFISNVDGSSVERVIQPNTIYNANMQDPARIHVRLTYYYGSRSSSPTNNCYAGILTTIFVQEEV